MIEHFHALMSGVSESRYATREDFLKIFAEDLSGLYQLSFLLTGNHQKGETCFVAAMEDCSKEKGVFRERACSWAKRMIVQNAIRELHPRPRHSNSSAPLPTVIADGQQSDIPIKYFAADAVLGLADFVRFAFVLCVLEGYRERECALLLGCSASKVREARMQAIEQLARFQARGFNGPSGVGSLGCRTLSRLVLLALLASVSSVVGCGRTHAAPAIPATEVAVASVAQKDVPIVSEWVATLDGYVNAQIQPQVTGYIIRQTYKEGSFVHKGQVLFQIDPRPFEALLDQANAQLSQAQAQLGKTEMDVGRDTPLARERAIAQSQLDNDIQANRAAKAAVKAAEAQVKQVQLNLEFTNVRSLVDGIAGIAQVQIGNLVNPTTVLTSVSQVDPIKAYFSISEQEYLHYAERINAQTQKESPSGGPPFELIVADGSIYPHKGTGLLTNRQVDTGTGSIQVVCSFPNPHNILRPGQFGRLRAAAEIRRGALLVPQKSVNELQGTYQLAVVSSDNKVSIRPVRVGERVGQDWIVESGVKPGELVIVEGAQKVQNGSTVKIKQATSAKGK
jgi:RND family efflux transporter MFP subunit